jgi:hypothetical protein
MSAEGKKKRGESGQANAKNIAFRNGGRSCDLSLRIGSTMHPRLAGARMLHALGLAWEIFKVEPTDRLLRAADEVIDHIARKGYKAIPEST